MATLIFPDGRQIENVQNIFFDKDGTIFDIHHYWCSMIKLRAQILTEKYNLRDACEPLCDAMGVNGSGNRLKPEGPVGIKPRSHIVKVSAQTMQQQGVEISEEEVEALFKEADVKSTDMMDDFLVILPGVKKFLEDCHKNSIKMVIATTDITSRAQKALLEKGLNHYFTSVYGGDLVENTKPAPDMADLIFNELCISRDESIMIGDHNVDVLLAKNASMLAGIGVTTGLLDRESLSANTDFVTDDLSTIEVC